MSNKAGSGGAHQPGADRPGRAAQAGAAQAGADGLWVCPERLFDGQRLRAGRAVLLRGGRVERLENAERLRPDAARVHVAGVLTPGFVDLQVNGGGGVLLNNTPSAEAMARIAAAHRGFGTVALLPTLITDRPEKMEACAAAAIEAQGTPGVVGVHLEGPHISRARRGTHAARFIRALDNHTQTVVAGLRAAGVPVMITLAPEAASPDQIGRLAETGAVVSIGHTDATAEQFRAARAAGARCVTHLYNAMSPMRGRAPGVTGAAINSDAWTGLICDGVHVADEMLALALRARPVADRAFLVSDAMPTVGGPDSFSLYGNEIRVVEGRLVNAEGALAGAHTTIAQGLARLVNVLGVAPDAALRMAVTTPARLMGLDALAVPDGRRAEDLLVLDAQYALRGTLCAVLGG